MSNFLINLALRGAGIPAAAQLSPSRSALLASEPAMFPGVDIPITNAATYSPPASNPPAAPTSSAIVQREPAAPTPPLVANPSLPLAPATQGTPHQNPAPPAALPSRLEPLSSPVSEPSRTPPTPSRILEVRPPAAIAFSEGSVRPSEPAHTTTPASLEAADAQATPVLPRVVVEPETQRATNDPPSIRITQSPVEALTPEAPIKPAELSREAPAIEERVSIEIGEAQPRPATFPAPAIAVMQPPTEAPVDSVQHAARRVEVRIGRIDVRVSSPPPPPSPVAPPAETLAARAAEGTGFEEYDGIRGYRFPTEW